MIRMSVLFANIQDFIGQNTTIVYFIRVLIATLCGIVIGLERTKRAKEAGIRTHCIIACASALVMIISKYGFTDLTDSMGNFFPGTRGADPARIAAQVVSGVSFLGTGVIFKHDSSIKGLTTAAGIWATAAVGLACGCGMYIIAILVTVLILIIQLVMHRLSIGNDAFVYTEIRIVLVDSPEIRAVLLQKQEELGITIFHSRITVQEDGLLEIVLNVRLKKPIPFTKAVDFMDAYPAIKSLSV